MSAPPMIHCFNISPEYNVLVADFVKLSFDPDGTKIAGGLGENPNVEYLHRRVLVAVMVATFGDIVVRHGIGPGYVKEKGRKGKGKGEATETESKRVKAPLVTPHCDVRKTSHS